MTISVLGGIDETPEGANGAIAYAMVYDNNNRLIQVTDSNNRFLIKKESTK